MAEPQEQQPQQPPRVPSVVRLRVPGRDQQEATLFLESLAAGGGVGTGRALGVDFVRIRSDYEREVARLIEGVNTQRGQGRTVQEIADWAVRERRGIATRMRMRQGVGATVMFEVRDNIQYGLGGRTVDNLSRRYSARGLTGDTLAEQMIKGALSPNTGISENVLRSARYLRYGGKVILVVGVTAGAVELY